MFSSPLVGPVAQAYHQRLQTEAAHERRIDQARPPGDRVLARGKRSAMQLLSIVLLIVVAVAGVVG